MSTPALALDSHPCAQAAAGRRHVLQLIETGGPGGAERVLVNLTQRLAADPVYRSTVGLLKSGWLESELVSRGLEIHRFRLRRPLDPVLLLGLARHLHRSGVDLVHAHEFTMNVYGAAAGRLAGVPVIATVHGRGYYAEARRRVVALRWAARFGATLVAVSTDIRRFLSDSLRCGPVRLIPNGIDLARVAGGDRARGRAALALEPEALVVGTVGNLYPVKGHQVLLKAAARLERPRVHVVIAGRGNEEAALRRAAAELGISDRVHLLGYREDVPDLIAAFDIYALPSFSEGQSLALIEAMAAGRPVVATAVGGNAEVLGMEDEFRATEPAAPVTGAHGVLVPPGDPEALAAALDRLLADPALARRLGESARARARREFSLEAMMDRYRALYAELLEREPREQEHLGSTRGGEGRER